MESYDWDKERVCIKKGESISVIKEREGRDIWIHWRTIEERVYQTLKDVPNGTSIFCRKEGW